MKNLLLLSLTLSSCIAGAQTWAYEELDINSVRTGINSNGDLFTTYSSGAFEVPADSGTHTMFAAAAWIGGLDAGGGLHLAAQTYRQTGNDFYPGPVMNTSSYSGATDAQWNRVWKINKTTLDSFLLWRNNPSAFPGYVIPSAILSWPGNGDVSLGQAPQLAPYIDANNDGVYEPSSGDYPCIKGDQALFVMFNDHRNVHGETGGNILGVEIHAMLYAYNAPGTWLDSTVFIHYQLHSRSSIAYTNVYWGQWTDYEIGNGFDDGVGCDVMRHMGFGYNLDANDGNSPSPGPGTYGAFPPAQGVIILNGPEADSADGIDNDRDLMVDEPGELCMMSYHTYYNNDLSITGNPVTPSDFYGYMHGFWKDGSPFTYGGNSYGGSTVSDFAYPHDSDPLGFGTNFIPQAPWDETNAGSIPGDRRSIISTGPFTLLPGTSSCIDFAYVHSQNSSHLASISSLRMNADSAESFYSLNNPCTCDENPLTVETPSSTIAGIYPNPANESINIICGDNATGSLVEILDVNGRIVQTTTVLSGNSVVVSTQELAPGVYFVRVNKGSVVLTGKFIRN